MKEKISVLGCGWLGLPLAKALINNGYTVKGTTTSQHKLQQLSSLKIQPYLFNLEELPKNISEFFNSEILIVNIPSKNIGGFKKLIKFIEKSAIQKVLFVSSTSVYMSAPNSITEESPLRDCELKSIEELFQKNNNFKTTILRFSGLFGYHRNPGNWFKNGRIIPNPEGVVNLIHQDDCIAIIEKIIANNSWNETFNAAADTHPKRRDFYTKAFLEVGRPIPVFNEDDEKSIKIISNAKVKKYFNYTFKFRNLLKLPKNAFI